MKRLIFLPLLFLVLYAGSCFTIEDDTDPPLVEPEAPCLAAIGGPDYLGDLQVQVFDRSEGGCGERLWSFGDGTTDTVKNPIHTYTECRPEYVITLEMQDLGVGGNPETQTRVSFECEEVSHGGIPVVGYRLIIATAVRLAFNMAVDAGWINPSDTAEQIVNKLLEALMVIFGALKVNRLKPKRP